MTTRAKQLSFSAIIPFVRRRPLAFPVSIVFLFSMAALVGPTIVVRGVPVAISIVTAEQSWG